MQMSFSHLHRLAIPSSVVLTGWARRSSTPKRLLASVKGALALTDHGTLSGALHHIAACKGKDSKGNKLHSPLLPITGVEAYFRPNRLRGEEVQAARGMASVPLRDESQGLAQPAEDRLGGLPGDWRRRRLLPVPVRGLRSAEGQQRGLACSSACISSWLSSLIAGGDSVAVSDYIDQMLGIFGENFWLEIMPHDFDEQRTLNVDLMRIGHDRSIPLLATNDVHFPKKEWAETQRVAKLCGSNSSFKKAEEDKAKGKASYLADLHPSVYLASEDEMRSWFRSYHPMIPPGVVDEAIQNTGLFVSKTTPFMLDRSDKLPKSIDDEGRDAEKILSLWIDEGWEKIQREYPVSHWEKWPKPTTSSASTTSGRR
jgi:DNA polymerase-3 subunit alpha